MFCRYCGSKMPDNYKFCADCGTPIAPTQTAPNQDASVSPALVDSANTESPYSAWIKQQKITPVYKPVGKKKKTAGLLGIFLGFLGVHRFYLGYTEIAFIQILLGVLGFATFGATALGAWIWGIIDAAKIFKGKIDKDADDNSLI